MVAGKKPFQFGPRTSEQKQRNGSAFAGQANQPPDPPLSPEMELRKRAVMRLDMLPPYQATVPHEVLLETPDGQQHVRPFKGFNKREMLCAMFVAAAISKDGMPLQDAQCFHLSRTAHMMSEALLQTLSKQRGIDIEETMKQIQQEDAMAASQDAAAARQNAEQPSES